jgi:hypothetical protein
MQIIGRLSFANILTILLQITPGTFSANNGHDPNGDKNARALTAANNTKQGAAESRDGANTYENDATQLHHCAFCRWPGVATFSYADLCCA